MKYVWIVHLGFRGSILSVHSSQSKAEEAVKQYVASNRYGTEFSIDRIRFDPIEV